MGFAGFLAGPALVFLFLLAAIAMDPRCGVSDSGGCAMGLFSGTVLAAVPSAVLAFIGAFIWGVVKLDWDKPRE
jgi:hypothetical protein